MYNQLIEINDGGEFGRTFTEVYLKEHRLEYELRLEYQGIHASIVNIIITSSSFCVRCVLLFFSVALINLLTFGLGGWGGGGG